MTLDALEFIRRFLQHVLPAGFQKVRHYGFLSGTSRLSVAAVRWVVTLHNGEQFTRLAKSVESARGNAPRPRMRCAECGAAMRVTLLLPPNEPVYCDTS